LSFSGGGSGGGRKGFSSAQKKERKKKQEFHRHKLKLADEESPTDPEQLKNRVAVSLDRLGHQVFSPEPGGYSFENWITSFNTLLDDFEEKAGGEALPAEYFEARQKFTADLLAPVDTLDIDSEIAAIDKEADSIREKISTISQKSQAGLIEEHGLVVSKIEKLKKDQKQSDADIKDARSELDEEKKKEARKSFFSKLRAGSASSPLKLAQAKLDGLRTKRDGIDKDLKQLEEDSANAQTEIKSIDEELAGLRAQLEVTQQKLGELGLKKQERTMLTEKRLATTTSLAGIITSLKLERAEEENQQLSSPS
jgi:hypothetical protein